MSNRILRINEQILHQLGLILERELNLKPGVMITLVRVDTTRDLRYTRVLVSVYPEHEFAYVLKSLNYEKYNLQKLLHQTLTLKQKPKLSFEYDATEVRAQEIENLLKKVAKEKVKK